MPQTSLWYTSHLLVQSHLRNMFWVFVFALGAASAAKLDNAYLPPPAAKDAGGSEGSLQVPLEPPYIDPYTPQSDGQQQPQQNFRPGTRSLSPNVPDYSDQNQFLQNEDELVAPPKIKQGKFISGSYSYTGPDNVLVTVTYKAANKQDDVTEEETDYDEEESYRQLDGIEPEPQAAQEEEEEDDDVIPTPRSLPGELARAFDFHKKKHNALEAKTHKNRKPIRGSLNKHKGHHSNDYNNKHSDHHNKHSDANSGTKNQDGGYHYQQQPQNLYGAPVVHQGYSYPKQSVQH